MRGKPGRKATGTKIAHAKEVHQRRDHDGADDAGQNHEDGGEHVSQSSGLRER